MLWLSLLGCPSPGGDVPPSPADRDNENAGARHDGTRELRALPQGATEWPDLGVTPVPTTPSPHGEDGEGGGEDSNATPAATPTVLPEATPGATPTPRPTPAPTPTPGPGEEATPEILQFSALPDTHDPLARTFDLDVVPPVSARIVCTEADGGSDRHYLVQGPAGEHHMVVRGLKADTTYQCQAEVGEDYQIHSDPISFTTSPLPDDLHVPGITRMTSRPADIGYTLYNYSILEGDSVYTSRYLVLLDAEGNVRWYLPEAGGGTIDVSLIPGDRLLYGGRATESTVPTIVDLDRQVLFVGTTDIGVDTEFPGSYHHDAGLSADGLSIFTLLYSRAGEGARGFVIRQLGLDNQILWTWDSVTDGIDTGALPPPTTDNPDPYHSNSIFDRWENGRLYLYLGLRNLNRILKIDFETREVVWQIGVDMDFTLLEQDGTPAAPHRWFFHQHDAKPYGTHLVMYDNGVLRRDYGGPYNFTRALELELDEKSKTARIVFEYAESDWIEPIWGGVDRLPNGDYLIAMGHCWDCTYANHPSALVQVSPAGEIVWRADFPDEQDAIYRAERVDGCSLFANAHYCPSLEDTGDSTTSARAVPSP